MNDIVTILDDPEKAYPDNFDTPKRANALLFGLCQEAAEEIKKLRTWVGLTDEELLQAYGWRLASGAPNWLLEEAKQELLGALRKVEASIKEKNT
jgi:predicted DNA-binding transcriptional regulator